MDSPLTYSVQWRNDRGEVVNFYENRYLLQQFLKIIFAGKSHHCHFFSFILWSKHQLAKKFRFDYSIVSSLIFQHDLTSPIFLSPYSYISNILVSNILISNILISNILTSPMFQHEEHAAQLVSQLVAQLESKERNCSTKFQILTN